MIVQNTNGTHSVMTVKGNTFHIVDSDPHTQSMLTDFLNSPENLHEFENLLDMNPQTAYQKYNKLADPIIKTQEEIDAEQEAIEMKDRALAFDSAMKEGKFEDAFYALHGIEKPKEEINESDIKA